MAAALYKLKNYLITVKVSYHAAKLTHVQDSRVRRHAENRQWGQAHKEALRGDAGLLISSIAIFSGDDAICAGKSLARVAGHDGMPLDVEIERALIAVWRFPGPQTLL